ncbi:MAG: class I SAM-dependent methyltransferase [Candidatus Hodarchaeota archaeon]
MVEEEYSKIWKRKTLERNNICEKGSRRDIASKLVNGGERILDIGCGNGILLTLVKSKYRELYGIDISNYALSIAKKHGVKTFKIDLNKEKLPFKDNFFDMVVCLDVIEHIFDPYYLLAEIHRVLKLKGELIISTPNIRFLKHLYSLLIKGRFPKTSNDFELYDGGHIHYFTFKDMKNILEKTGFKILIERGVLRINFLKSLLSPGIVIKAKKNNF